ncbi:MAG: hypothetical protein ACI8TQ_002147 [Planctomycetota bacterium]|jgi:hypothetical protein
MDSNDDFEQGAEEAPRTAADMPLPGGNFRLFIQRLSYQGLMSMGVLPNPLTKQTRLDLNHARMLLDDLSMIAEKTRGNLEPDESEHLFKIVRDLTAQFESAKKGAIDPDQFE